MCRSFMSCFRNSRQTSETDEGQSGDSVSEENLESEPQSQLDYEDPQRPPMADVMSEDELRERLNGHGPTFTFEELSDSTRGFHQEALLGYGGFGEVYKGFIERIQQTVAVKRQREGSVQGDTEFVREVILLSRVDHPNIVKLLGYCFHGSERLVVYEYFPLGSLDKHLFDRGEAPLDWNTRMKIARGVARALEYLHTTMDPPIIYRDTKSPNILLDDEFNAKLSDFGLAREGPTVAEDGSVRRVFSRRMGTEGYASPQYEDTGGLTSRSDVYGFGVLLCEIIMGRKAFDPEINPDRPFLVDRVKAMPATEGNFLEMVDPRLRGNYHKNSLFLYFDCAHRCLLINADLRPDMTSVRQILDTMESLPSDPSDLPPETSHAGEMRGRQGGESLSDDGWDFSMVSPR